MRLALFLFSMLLSASFISTFGQSFSLEDCVVLPTAEMREDLPELFAEANDSFADDEDFDREQLCEALRLYERILELEPVNAEALNRSAQGYFMLALEYLESVDERVAAYLRGRERGITRLGVELPENLDFLCAVSLPVIEALEPDAHVAEEESALAGLFWAGNNWGRWLDNLSEISQISKGFSDLPCLEAIFAKAVELDETYFGAGPRRALGSFIAGLPGPNLASARENYERAIELAPDYLENKVLLACGVAVPLGDRDLFDQLLEEVLSSSKIGQYFFWNNRARRLASELLSSADELFSGSGQCEL